MLPPFNSEFTRNCLNKVASFWRDLPLAKVRAGDLRLLTTQVRGSPVSCPFQRMRKVMLTSEVEVLRELYT